MENSFVQIIHDHSYRAVQATALRDELRKFPLTRNVIICCGIDAVDEALGAKQQGDFLISIGDPQKAYEGFEALVLLDYEPMPQHRNIIPVKGLLNEFAPEILVGNGEGRFDDLPSPCYFLLLGGRHVGGNVSVDDAKILVRKLNEVAGSVLVSTSKRSEENLLPVLKEELKIPHVIYDFNYDGQDANPYLLMLARADAVIVTADSARMCSEVCSSGKAVYIYSPQQVHFSYAALKASLVTGGYANDFVDLKAQIKPTKLLAEAKRVAEIIYNQL